MSASGTRDSGNAALRGKGEWTPIRILPSPRWGGNLRGRKLPETAMSIGPDASGRKVINVRMTARERGGETRGWRER